MKEKETKRKYKEEGKKGEEEESVFRARVRGRISKEWRDANRINWTAFMNYFNSVMDLHNSGISRLQVELGAGTKRRLQYLANQWGKNLLVTVINKMAESDVLSGRCAKIGYWSATLYWVIKTDERFEQVLNGVYDNPKPLELSPDEKRRLEQEARKHEAARLRALAREIDEEEREKRAAERDSWPLTSCTYEEYQRMVKNGKLKMDRSAQRDA